MDKEVVESTYMTSSADNYILELPTGYGKTRLALLKAQQLTDANSKILVVVPRTVLKKDWAFEIKKWHVEELLPRITFVCYKSFEKTAGDWDVVIFDEGHHTSERCRALLNTYHIKHSIVLSATLGIKVKGFFLSMFKGHVEYTSVKVKDAIDTNVLPDPEIILLPMMLDNTVSDRYVEKKAKKGNTLKGVVTVSYRDRWKWKNYTGAYRILCTQQQYFNEMDGLISWYKRRYGSNNQIYMHKCLERLKWLADQKTPVIKDILKIIKSKRSLTFCPGIDESKQLKIACVNSKEGTDNLDLFNEKKINHIATVGMLDEGANLTDCQIGLFQMINSSDRLSIQRIGRILRHKKPVLVFPYYKYTREEEVVKKLVGTYNQEKVKVLTSTEDLKLYLK